MYGFSSTAFIVQPLTSSPAFRWRQRIPLGKCYGWATLWHSRGSSGLGLCISAAQGWSVYLDQRAQTCGSQLRWARGDCTRQTIRSEPTRLVVLSDDCQAKMRPDPVRVGERPGTAWQAVLMSVAPGGLPSESSGFACQMGTRAGRTACNTAQRGRLSAARVGGGAIVICKAKGRVLSNCRF